jgi:hypothetical protein
MSLEGAVELDSINEAMRQVHHESVNDTFSPTQFRQPSLVEKALQPEKYRNKGTKRHETSPRVAAEEGSEGVTNDLEPEECKCMLMTDE